MTCLDSSSNIILNYLVDSVDTTPRMQACAHNETAHMLFTRSRIPMALQLHTYKQYLTNFITSANIELLYIYGAN